MKDGKNGPHASRSGKGEEIFKGRTIPYRIKCSKNTINKRRRLCHGETVPALLEGAREQAGGEWVEAGGAAPPEAGV